MRTGRISLALLGALAATLATVVPAQARQVSYSRVVLYNGQTDKCMRASDASDIVLGACGDDASQWNIIPDDGYNMIQNVAYGLCIYNYQGNIIQATLKSCNGDPPVLWDADFVSNSTWLFQNHANPAICLDAGQTHFGYYWLEFNNCFLSNLYQDWVTV